MVRIFLLQEILFHYNLKPNFQYLIPLFLNVSLLYGITH